MITYEVLALLVYGIRFLKMKILINLASSLQKNMSRMVLAEKLCINKFL